MAALPGEKGFAKMWSVRMSASRDHGSRAITARSTHVSGAEGIYSKEDLSGTVIGYTQRALAHPRGMPDNITVKIQRLRRRPRPIKALSVRTLMCGSPAEAKKIATKLLRSLGVKSIATASAFKVLRAKSPMRGAAIVDAESGERLEPNKRRGIRASCMGIEKDILGLLRSELSQTGIDVPQVREALVLASKVASTEGLVAELCASDDPDYTTGYLASAELGYLRIPNIKKSGSERGGRIFFIRAGVDLELLLRYIEETPVMVTDIAPVSGEIQSYEFICNNYS